MFNIPIFLITFVSATIALQVMLRKENNGFAKKLDNLMDDERKANLTVKKNIDANIFIEPDITKLPFKEYSDTPENQKLINIQNLVKRKAELKMVKFDKTVTNTDLKLKFGMNNLENITFYEEHYNSYVKALNDWAEILIKINNISDAEIILKETIDFRSDLSSSFIMLAEIYKMNNNINELNNLKEKIKNSNLKLKNKILNSIETADKEA